MTMFEVELEVSVQRVCVCDRDQSMSHSRGLIGDE